MPMWKNISLQGYMWYHKAQDFAELAILLGHESDRSHEEMADE